MQLEKKIGKEFRHYKIEYSKLYAVNKRVIDFILAVALIVLLLPLFILIALLIKIDDPNDTVFFNQIRVGKNEKEFKIYKFRTMYKDAEERLEKLLQYNEIEGAMFKLKDDPRITKVGKFLRQYSLDEFPQLINVLKGEMSLVGPRPPLVREVKLYTLYDKQRLFVTPGITGLWQVSGRNSLTFSQMVELDLVYIQKLSTFNDLKIMLKTVVVMVAKKDAY